MSEPEAPDPHYPVGHECPECHQTILSLNTWCEHPVDVTISVTCADHWRKDQDLDVMSARAKANVEEIQGRLDQEIAKQKTQDQVIVEAARALHEALKYVTYSGAVTSAKAAERALGDALDGKGVMRTAEEQAAEMVPGSNAGVREWAREDDGPARPHNNALGHRCPVCGEFIKSVGTICKRPIGLGRPRTCADHWGVVGAGARNPVARVGETLELDASQDVTVVLPEPEPEVSWKDPSILVEPDDDELARWICEAFECDAPDHRNCATRSEADMFASRRLIDLAFAASVNTVRECARCKEIDEEDEEDIYDTVGRYRRSPRGLATHLVTIKNEDERVKAVVDWARGQRWTGDDVDIWVALQEQLYLPFPMAVFQFAGAQCVIVGCQLKLGEMHDPNPLMKLNLELRRVEKA